MRLRFRFALSALVATLVFSSRLPAQTAASAGPQASVAVALHPDLLPASFGDWKAVPSSGSPATTVEPSFSLVNANKRALEECGPERSAVQ
ncbi:MAG TPA: hypothetical protein VKV02_09470, partial [Acidobacteriaceae bacterium]|nr:hypothetical protein [Acidobacteriaceae bacterium]